MGDRPGLVGLLVALGVLTLAGPASAASSGATFAWGSGAHGQLGDGSEADSDVPAPVSDLSEVSAVSAGYIFGLALLDDGTVAAWGDGESGLLGDGSEASSDVPVAVNGLSEVKAIAAGWYHSLALLSNGTVEAWGYNGFGELGDGSGAGSSAVPVSVSGLDEVAAVSAGSHSSLALLKDGTVMAWGDNESGQLGDGTSTGPESCSVAQACSGTPVPVGGLSEVTAVAAGSEFNLALLKNGTVVAWGSNYYGELGDGTTTSSDVPVPVSGLSEVTAIAAGLDDGLALLKNGAVVAWGSNVSGQLGDSTNTGPESCVGEYGTKVGCSRVPVAVSGLRGVSAVSAGSDFSLALLDDGRVMAWGENAQGELGDRSTVNSDVPVGVTGVSKVTAISAGSWYEDLAVAEPYVAPLPSITKVEPVYGPPAGGTQVTITGTNFTDATEVEFGSISATSFKVESETKIIAVAPPGTGTVDVGVAAIPGVFSATSAADQFSYAPVVSKVEPNHGAAAGGTAVTITGANFTGATGVRFGPNEATSVEVESDTKITAVSPAGAGTVDVTVEAQGGSSSTSEADHFSYVPVTTSVTPDHGPPSGGTKVTITGTNLAGATAVHFGSTEAASFKVESETEITAVSPTFTGGDDSMPVFVTTPGGTNGYECGEEQVGFIYEPTVTKVEPRSGPAAGGTEVTIIGAAFEGSIWGKEPLCTLGAPTVQWVDFGSIPAKSLNIVSESEITAVAPPGTGTVDVTVKGAHAVGHSPIVPGDQFSYGTPVIEGESVSSITEHDATLEAQVNPIGHETEYEFWLQCAAHCGSSSPERVGLGHIPADDSAQSVSADLSDLQPGSSYTYWVVAASSEGKTQTPPQSFDTLPEPPVVPPPNIGSGNGSSQFSTTSVLIPTAPITATLGGMASTALAFSDLLLPAVQHGDSLLVALTIAFAGSRVEVDTTEPVAQVSSAKRNQKRTPFALARVVRTNVAAGRLKLTVPLNTNGKRTLKRHKHLTLTVKIIVIPPTGKPQTATRTVTLKSG